MISGKGALIAITIAVAVSYKFIYYIIILLN